MSKPVVISGIQPTGFLHIGNYLGALKNWVEIQNSDKYECFFFIADFHSLTGEYTPQEKKTQIFNLACDFLAAGIDPKKSTIFLQSDVSECAELAWIFNTITPIGELERMTQFKDKAKKQKLNVNTGLLTYPILQAADILIYHGEFVPVGQDQKQHVEYARDVAEKFNRIFGETFKLPKEIIIKGMENIPGLDGQKMSKSYNNTIPLFASYEEIRKCVMAIVTDSSGEIPKNVYAIHKLLRPENELEKIYEEKKGKYKELKELLIEDMEKFIAPMREKREELAKDIPKALEILREGNEKARKIAIKKLEEIRERIGVNI